MFFSLRDERLLLLWVHRSPLSCHSLYDIIVTNGRILSLYLATPHVLIAEERTHWLFGCVRILFLFYLLFFFPDHRWNFLDWFGGYCFLLRLLLIFLRFFAFRCGFGRLGGFDFFLCCGLTLALHLLLCFFFRGHNDLVQNIR